MPAPRTPWGRGVEEYLGVYGEIHLAPHTREDLKSIFSRFGAHIGPIAVDEVDLRRVESYQLSLIRAGVAKSTCNKHLRHLRSFFSWAVTHGYAERNPCDGAKQVKAPRTRRPITTQEETVTLVNYLDRIGESYYSDFIRLVANTGLRSGQALFSREEDVEWEGDPGLWIRCREEYMPKDRKESRIPLNEAALCVLRKRKLQAIDGWLWAHPKRKKVPKVCSVGHAIKRFSEAAGVPGFTMYSLRHAFGTRMACAVPESVLAALMTHSHPNTSRKFYVHASEMKLAAPPDVSL